MTKNGILKKNVTKNHKILYHYFLKSPQLRLPIWKRTSWPQKSYGNWNRNYSRSGSIHLFLYGTNSAHSLPKLSDSDSRNSDWWISTSRLCNQLPQNYWTHRWRLLGHPHNWPLHQFLPCGHSKPRRTSLSFPRSCFWASSFSTFWLNCLMGNRRRWKTTLFTHFLMTKKVTK